MKITAIILSAGSGKRMNADTKKQYIQINGKPIIWYTLRSFQNSDVDDIVLVTGYQDIEYCKEMVQESDFYKVTTIVAGGEERYDSVYNGLLACDETDYVLIHDGARPAVDADTIKKNIEKVVEKKACITAVPLKDTIKRVDDKGIVIDTPKRSEMWAIQTPQSFAYNIILNAYNRMKEAEYSEATDDSMIVEKFGDTEVSIIEGKYTNIKVTTQEDLVLLKDILK